MLATTFKDRAHAYALASAEDGRRREEYVVRVAIVGGSIAGLAAAILLARQGHDVHVFDRDDTRPASDVDGAARGAWRIGAPHSPHGHGLPGLGRRVLRARLPDVYDELLANGVRENYAARLLPAAITDRAAQPGDDEICGLRTRRSTFEWIFRRAAAREPGVAVHHAAIVGGLVADDGGVPRVRGIQVTGLGVMAADLVIDAAGRGTPVPDWLTAVGARAPAFAFGHCAIVYYTRHYRVRAGLVAPERQPGQTGPIVAMLPFGNALLFPSDNDTVQLSTAALIDDRPLKALRHVAAFDAFVRMLPALGPWLDVLEPISDVWVMGAPRNVLRHDVVDGVPVALGLVAIGDAVCNTNPQFGRGMSLALAQAAALADVLAAHPSDPDAQVLALDDALVRDIEPWYHDQVAQDDFRVAATRAAVFGSAAPPPPTIGGGFTLMQVATAASRDPVVWRAFIRRQMMLDAPLAMFEDAAVTERLRAALATGPNAPQPSGPSRAEVLDAIGAAVPA